MGKDHRAHQDSHPELWLDRMIECWALGWVGIRDQLLVQYGEIFSADCHTINLISVSHTERDKPSEFSSTGYVSNWTSRTRREENRGEKFKQDLSALLEAHPAWIQGRAFFHFRAGSSFSLSLVSAEDALARVVTPAHRARILEARMGMVIPESTSASGSKPRTPGRL